MRSYYAARAQEYDRVYLKPERQADLRALQRLLPGMFKGRCLLEVACGTGYWTQFIAPAAARILAIDAAAETIAVARNRIFAGQVRWAVGDAYRLPLAPGTFNAAFAGFWFSHVPRRRQREFLGGLGAFLLPGARIVLVDNLCVEGSNTPVAERDAEGDAYQVRRLEDGSSHRVLKNFPSEAELKKLVAGLGRKAEYRRLTYFWTFAYEATGAP